MKTRILMSVLAIGLSIALIGGATMAWFTDEAGPVEATFTAGTVDIEMGDEVVWEGELEDNWNPGDTTPASINFKSLGSKQTYVRAKYVIDWIENDGEDDLPIENVTVDVNDDDWIDGGDGWYYYKNILNNNGVTTDLFTSVILDGPKTGNEYQGRTLTLKVTAQAIQASNGAAGSNEGNGWGVTLPNGVEVWVAE